MACWRVGAGVVAVVPLLACSVSIGGGGLNATKLQDAIRDRIRQNTGVAPDTVTCPSDAKQGKGNDFRCAAVVAGQPVTVEVAQTDDSGHVSFAAAEAMLHRTDVERFIQNDVDEKGRHHVAVNCGTTAIVVAKVGSTFSCTLDSGSGAQTAAVTVHSADGRFSVRYPPAGTPSRARS